MAWDLDPHLDKLEFVLQVDWHAIISRVIAEHEKAVLLQWLGQWRLQL